MINPLRREVKEIAQRVEPPDLASRYIVLVRWCKSHNITAAELLIAPVVFWFAFALFLSGLHVGTQRSGLYREMLDVAPIMVWITILSVAGSFIIFGTHPRYRYLTQIGFVASAAFFFIIAGLIIIEVSTLLTPALYIMVGIGCLYRYAEIGVGEKE